jgi:hypothetical protein
MPKYHSREEVMRHRLNVRIKGPKDVLPQAALEISKALERLGRIVDWTDFIQDEAEPDKARVFLNVDTNKEA